MAGNVWTQRAQARTLITADNWGQPWDAEEIEMVGTFGDTTAEELALALGRTVYAVNAVREALRLGDKVGGGRARVIARAEVGYTFIGDDVPPGWWD